MEYFTKARAIKLRSHLDKYLVADSDGEKVHQSRNGTTLRAKWLVEPVVDLNDSNTHRVRLRSCHGKYLAATETPFLLGMTGNRVVQGEFDEGLRWKFEWEPVRDGFQVRLRSWSGKFLRGNGGTPPWRNTVTHDDPVVGISSDWVLWDVEAVEEDCEMDGSSEGTAVSSSFAFSDELSAGSEPPSPMSVILLRSPMPVRQSSKLGQTPPSSNKFRTGMDFFRHAKAVRLRSHHDKYLLAGDDEDSVKQDRNASSMSARWFVEYVHQYNNIIRLKSCYGKYLTASSQPFLLGMTGQKVLQTLPSRLDSSVEWEPVKDGGRVKLKTRYGNFLRGNGGVPPWRNTVTHDIPNRTATQDWILWDVDVVEIHVQNGSVVQDLNLNFKPSAPPLPSEYDDAGERYEVDVPSPVAASPARAPAKYRSFFRYQWSDSSGVSSPRLEGRTIFYHVAEDNGEVPDEGVQAYSLNFKGNGVEELTRKFEEETGLEGIIVCNKSPLSGKLYPLRLSLPPNNVTMQVVLVLPHSKVARDFEAQGLL